MFDLVRTLYKTLSPALDLQLDVQQLLVQEGDVDTAVLLRRVTYCGFFQTHTISFMDRSLINASHYKELSLITKTDASSDCSSQTFFCPS